MLTRNYPEEIQFHNQIYFHIPAIYHRHILLAFCESIYFFLEQYKRNDIKIIAYGCPSFCIWNGGRFMDSEVYRIETIKALIDNYIGFGIDLQFTFTNTLLQETDVYDRYGNAILDIAYEYKEHCEIMVVSDILETYIRNKYPDLRIVRSIVNQSKPTDDIIDKYSTIVVPIYLNHDKEYLKSLVDKNVNVELLVDEDCVIDCPYKKSHYDITSRTQLFIPHENCLTCVMPRTELPQSHNILPDELNEYIDMGIYHFKLSDRKRMSKTIESSVYYMIPYNLQQELRQIIYERSAIFLQNPL